MSKQQPPKLPLLLLQWFCRSEYHKDIEGDLMELYDKRQAAVGSRKASWLLLRDVLFLFRPGIIRSSNFNQKLSYKDMLQHTLLVAFRNFKRHRSILAINLLGLSSGLAVTLVIFLWVQDELGIDKFHQKDARLYQVMGHHQQASDISTWNGTSAKLAEALSAEIPEVEIAVGATDPAWQINFDLTANDKKVKAIGKYAGADYFKLFSYPLVEGDKAQVLTDISSIVISEELALKLFNSTNDVVGKTIEWSWLSLQSPAIISGVFKAPPANSTDQFDFLLPFTLHQKIEGSHWKIPNAVTYVLLRDGAQVQSANEKLAGFMDDKIEDANVTLFLKPYSESYLYGRYENGLQSGGRIEYVRLFSLIAVFILVIACINFMNLATAKAATRMKEVGVKKVIGASRSALIFQYLTESVLLAFLSTLAAVAMVGLFLPQFNVLIGKELSLEMEPNWILTVATVSIGTGILAGAYPALYLSTFKPAAAFRNKVSTSIGELWVRKGLVVFQFTLSIIMIVAVLVVSRQMDLIQTKNLGYDRENVILFNREGKAAESLEDFLTALKNVPGVVTASALTNDILHAPGVIDFDWEGKSENHAPFSRFIVHYDFIEALGVELKSGRTFSRQFGAGQKIILNESAVDVMGLEEPIGARATLWGQPVDIVGVVKDFHFRSLHEKVGPMFFHLDSRYAATIVSKIEAKGQGETLARIADFYQEFNPGYTFDFRFLDHDYEALYSAENKVASLSKYFASIAILISCLGLLGLASFTADRRMKEIGVRKIMGSSVFGITRMLSADFMKIVMLAIVLSIPISYFITSNWLSNFAYSIDLSWKYFALAAIVSLLISWLTISLQTIKAARANPVKCLRDD